MSRSDLSRLGLDEPHCAWDLGAKLGEGPIWVDREQSLYFVDIVGCMIHRLGADGSRQTWSTAAEPGFIVPSRTGRYVCGLRGGLFEFDPAGGTFKLLLAVEKHEPHHRINDGLVDSLGRLWFGTMNDDAQSEDGKLYRLEKDNSLSIHDAGYIVTNGPVVSPDGSTLYHTDSIRREIYRFDLSASGTLSNKSVFVKFDEGVHPDGMAMDVSGNLWVAVFNGWRIECYSPTGEKAAAVYLPCAQVTKPAFGGSDLHTLYVSTARLGLTSDDLAKQPLAGALFSLTCSTPGLRLNPLELDPSL